LTDETLVSLLARVDDLLVTMDSWEEPQDGRNTISFDVLRPKWDTRSSLIDARESIQRLIAATDKEYERLALPVESCQCVESDNSLCSIHTVGHPWQLDHLPCCTEPEDAHRHMTREEFDTHHPKVFDETVEVGDARYRVDGRHYHDGIGFTLTRLFPVKETDDPDDEASGLCFDIDGVALKATLPLLTRAVAAMNNNNGRDS